MGLFELKKQGSIGGAFGIFGQALDLLAPLESLIGLLNPLIAVAVGLLEVQKLIMGFMLAPILALLGLAGGVTAFLRAIIQKFEDFLLSIKAKAYTGALAQYLYTGTSAGFGPAATVYYAHGEPGATDPHLPLHALVLVTANHDAWQGLSSLFQTDTSPPPPPTPDPVNGVTKAQLDATGGPLSVHWVTSLADPATFQVKLVNSANGVGVPGGLKVVSEAGKTHGYTFIGLLPPIGTYHAELTLAGVVTKSDDIVYTPPVTPPKNINGVTLAVTGGQVQVKWATDFDGKNNYNVRIQLLIPPDPPEDPTATPPVPPPVIHPPVDIPGGQLGLMNESGKFHALTMTTNPTLIDGRKYLVTITAYDVTSNAVLATGTSAEIPWPVVPPAIALPADGGGITFINRKSVALMMPSLDSLINTLDAAIAPLLSAIETIAAIVDDKTKRKNNMQAMLDYYEQEVVKLKGIVKDIQAMLKRIGTFTGTLGAVIHVGDLYVYHYTGTAPEMGAAIALQLAAGVPGGGGPSEVVNAMILVAEDELDWGFLKIISGGG